MIASLLVVNGGRESGLTPMQQTLVDAVRNQVNKRNITPEAGRRILEPHGLAHHCPELDPWATWINDQRFMSALCAIETPTGTVGFVIGTRDTDWVTRSRLFDALKGGHAPGVTGEIHEIEWLGGERTRHIDIKPVGIVPAKYQVTVNALSIRKLTTVETTAYWTERERSAA